MRLQGKSALITGGGSGLGLAVANAYLHEGASVCIMDRDAARVEAFTGRSERTCGVTGDVTQPGAHTQAVAKTLEHFGQLDIYVGNAGIWDYSRPLHKMSLEELDRTFDELMSINVKGMMLGARAALPHLVRGSGCMIFTLSNAAFYPDGGGVVYTASKHAALGLVRQLAFECAPHVRVNGVAPGAMASNLRGPEALNMAQRDIQSLPVADALANNLPIDTWADPADVAAAYVFLAAANESGYATGSVVQVDGGFGVRGLGRGRLGDGLDKWSASTGE